jgi:hypothetical protein
VLPPGAVRGEGISIRNNGLLIGSALPKLPSAGEGENRPNGRSIRLSCAARSHRLEPVGYHWVFCTSGSHGSRCAGPAAGRRRTPVPGSAHSRCGRFASAMAGSQRFCSGARGSASRSSVSAQHPPPGVLQITVATDSRERISLSFMGFAAQPQGCSAVSARSGVPRELWLPLSNHPAGDSIQRSCISSILT